MTHKNGEHFKMSYP